jgi:hypothetical protein
MNRGTVLLCAIVGCICDVKPGQLMCASHWRRVPRLQQQNVYSTHALLRKASPATVRDAARAYRLAREQAVKWMQP